MKCMIRNALGDTVKSFSVPMSPANAATFCDAFLEGTYKVYEETSKVGSDVGVISAYHMTVQYSNTTSNKKGYLSMIVKSTEDETSVAEKLNGLTLNGILIDRVVVIYMSAITFA